MPTRLTFTSTRFGTVDIDDAEVIDFPEGLIGLSDRRWALVPADAGTPFRWLHALERPDLALPVTSPWAFFEDFSVELSDADSERVGGEDPADIEVLVTVRASSSLSEFSANLRAPILICEGRGHQLINEIPRRNAPCSSSPAVRARRS